MPVNIRIAISSIEAMDLCVGRVGALREGDEQGVYTYEVWDCWVPADWRLLGTVRHRRSARVAALVRKALALYEKEG